MMPRSPSASSSRLRRLKSLRNIAQGGDKPDFASLAYGEYGGKAGIWRIMDVSARNSVKGTIDTNGRIAEDFPDALKELHAGGHEIVGHGWVNDTALICIGCRLGTEPHPANPRQPCLGNRQAAGRLGQPRTSNQRIHLAATSLTKEFSGPATCPGPISRSIAWSMASRWSSCRGWIMPTI